MILQSNEKGEFEWLEVKRYIGYQILRTNLGKSRFEDYLLDQYSTKLLWDLTDAEIFEVIAYLEKLPTDCISKAYTFSLDAAKAIFEGDEPKYLSGKFPLHRLMRCRYLGVFATENPKLEEELEGELIGFIRLKKESIADDARWLIFDKIKLQTPILTCGIKGFWSLPLPEKRRAVFELFPNN